MYKQQHAPARALRESWQLLEQSRTTNDAVFADAQLETNSRISEPITILSADETEANAASKGILPGHDGRGLFTGVGEYTDESTHTAERIGNKNDFESLLRQFESAEDHVNDYCLDSVLDEVIESVDAATQLHCRSRSNSRIEEWLGSQSRIHLDRKRKSEDEEANKIKTMTQRILRDLLGIDRDVLHILFSSQGATMTDADRRASNAFESKVWKRWIELTKRDTASIHKTSRPSYKAGPPSCRSVRRSSNPSDTMHRNGLEKIPWGIPEETTVEHEYWGEELSVPIIFKYLKSYFQTSQTNGMATNLDADMKIQAEKKQQVRASQTCSTRTQTETVTNGGASTINAAATAIGQSASQLSRHYLTRAARNQHRMHGIRGRSTTSRSSSFKTSSLRTGTCSVASVRRSMIGSNFWDVGSLGGASGQGNWSIYA